MTKSTKRRGTVLVLILGALALISIVTLVYVSIGQADRRMAAVTVRNDHVDSVSQRIAEYASRIIGDAVFATYVDGTDRGQPVLVRRLTDFPFTDPYRRSVTTDVNRRFHPTGSYESAWSSGVDPRIPGSPYLAANRPTWFPPSNFNANSPPPLYDQYRDWYHITNIAPDGAFVNLANLRNNWEAAPTRPNGVPQAGDMRYGLTLLNEQGQSTFPAQLPFGAGQANVNTPAHFTLFQQRAFRRTAGPWYANVLHNRPDSIHYPHNQWADTDGDGFFDARWFELIDATDSGNILSFIPRDSRFRYFAAVRIIDLSANVNVNTATDFRAAARPVKTPGVSGNAGNTIAVDQRPVLPLGRTPSEVDLRRILMMTDAYWDAPNNQPWAYQLFANPAAVPIADPYLAYNSIAARDVGLQSYEVLSRWLRPWFEPFAIMSADQRLFYHEDTAAKPGAHYLGSNTFEVSTRFGNPDLFELLMHHGVNSTTSSRLEEVLGGQGSTSAPQTQRRVGILRDNRSMYDERDGLNPQQALARAYFDLRQILTTISGARPLRASMLSNTSPYRNALAAGVDEAVHADAALRSAVGLGSGGQQNPSTLFRAYADGLLPHAWRQTAWTTGRTMHYAGDPELAMRIAAHMTANMAAAYRSDASVSRPNPYTLLIDETFRSNVEDLDKYPWWTPRPASGTVARPRSLDLNADPNEPSRLSPGAAGLSSRALNIWGIKPQPFLTNITSFHVYTDAPQGAGGDMDWAPPFPPGTRTPITISGGAETDRFQKPPGYSPATPDRNPDYLGQVVVFQLTNPFDVEINLTGTANARGYTDYYIEFGRNGSEPQLLRLENFRALEINPGSPGSARQQEIRLRPGETRAAVIMSHSLSQMHALWRTNSSAPLSEETVLRFIDQQASVDRTFEIDSYDPQDLTPDLERVRPWIIRRMDANTGDPIPLANSTQPASAVDLFSGGAGSTDVAYLWRTIDDGPFALGTHTVQQFRAQHYLADRLRDPATPGTSTLDRRLRPGNHDINNTTSGPEDCTDGCDNTGFTIVMWGSISRRANPQLRDSTPLGALPAYCVEARFGVAGIPGDAAASAVNLRDTDGVTGIPSRGDFSGNNGAHTFSDWLDKVLLPAGGDGAIEPIVKELTELPGDRTTGRIQQNRDGRDYQSIYPQILANNDQFRITPPGSTTAVSVLRVADMLMPLALGPCHDPEAGTPSPTDPYPGWITLAEAMSLALNYSAPPTPPASNPNPDTYDIWYNIGNPNDPDYYALDRGQLLFDRFVPFEGTTANRRFPGIPLGLHLLNIFRAGNEVGSLAEKTPGVININTAPLSVVRGIPLLSPTLEYRGNTPPPDTSLDWQWNDWKEQSGLVPSSGVSPVPDRDVDIAAALLAYRDKLPVFDRGDLVQGVEPFPNRFQDPGELGVLLNANPTGTPPPPQRSLVTEIDRLRDQPGIATRAELMAIRTPPTNALGDQHRNSMDVLAFDGVPSGTAGMATSLYRNRSEQANAAAVTKRSHSNEISDSFDEQLLIANAAMGSIAVRSDVFAVWILLHGYQRSDTENLGNDDPLTPTIAKRYVMVVDRSNVTRKGQRPEILFIKEVPIR